MPSACTTTIFILVPENFKSDSQAQDFHFAIESG